MKVTTTLYLFVLACLLGGLVWLVEGRRTRVETSRVRPDRLIEAIGPDVTTISLTHGDVFVSLARRDGVWLLQRPFVARADAGTVERLIGILEDLPREERISVAQRDSRALTLADYGLEYPRGRIVLGGRNRHDEILVGDDAPVGDHVYVCLAADDAVVATSRRLLAVLPPDVDALRDRAALHGESRRTVKVEIQRPGGGFVQILRNGNEWRLQQPLVARADKVRVNALLDAVFGLRVTSFVRDPSPEGARAPSPAAPPVETAARADGFGLAPDQAIARIRVWCIGDDVGQELLIGTPANPAGSEVYAQRRGEETIFTLDARALDALAVDVNALRDRFVFGMAPEDVCGLRLLRGDAKLALERDAERGWFLSEPVKWKADEEVVEGLIDRLSRLRVTRFLDEVVDLAERGLDPPVCTIEMSSDTGTFGPRGTTGEWSVARVTLLLGLATADTAQVSAKLATAPDVFELDANSVQPLNADFVDPLIFHDRTVLAIPREKVRSIQLVKEGQTSEVVRDSDGWKPAGGGTNVVDLSTIENVLFHAANLRAVRIESINPADLSVYGLNTPGTRLTFGLSGEEGIRKTVLLGFATSPGGGVYGTVQGQDVVFVLDYDVVFRMTRDMLLPVPRDP